MSHSNWAKKNYSALILARCLGSEGCLAFTYFLGMFFLLFLDMADELGNLKTNV
jgi:hypothetical protein